MAVLSVRLSDEESYVLKKCAKLNNKTMSTSLKDAFFEMIEEQYDLEIYDKSYAAYRKDSKTYTTKEVCKELGIEI